MRRHRAWEHGKIDDVSTSIGARLLARLARAALPSCAHATRSANLVLPSIYQSTPDGRREALDLQLNTRMIRVAAPGEGRGG